MQQMIPAVDYNQIITRLTNAFLSQHRDNASNCVRMVGIVFARPSSPLAKSEIIPALADWHHRSGDHVHFFFAGYDRYRQRPGFIRVAVPGMDDWGYGPEVFNDIRQQIESRTKWQYSGGCDLLLTNARFDSATQKADIDFSSTIVCQLDAMKEDKAIPSVERFFESIFRFAESADDRDPTWGFSDKQGLSVAGSALKRVVLSLLPRNLAADYRKAVHFAIRDVAAT